MDIVEIRPKFPRDIKVIDVDRRLIRRALRNAKVPVSILDSIRTKACLSGRRQTGKFAGNRKCRWKLNPADPQYGSERDCKLIQIRLMAMLLLFENGPRIDKNVKATIENRYLGVPVVRGSYRDSLLLERPDYRTFVRESKNRKHGLSKFHLGHEDPQKRRKHVPMNISWRTERSNLIQGDRTLRQARIYFLKLIGRYFELGELNVR